ncbi:MAG: hypothetical protein ACLFSG_05985 [Halothiobacillaceae bacterium]
MVVPAVLGLFWLGKPCRASLKASATEDRASPGKPSGADRPQRQDAGKPQSLSRSLAVVQRNCEAPGPRAVAFAQTVRACQALASPWKEPKTAGETRSAKQDAATRFVHPNHRAPKGAGASPAGHAIRLIR